MNPIRMSGMASGMDTEAMVQKLMSAERVKVDRFFQQKTRNEYKQKAYNDVNRLMANFILDAKKNLGLTRTTSTGLLLSGSSAQMEWVNKAASDSKNFDVKATAAASQGSYDLRVEQLAEGVSVSSTQGVAGATVGEMMGEAKDSYTLHINGKDIVLGKDETLTQAAKKIRDTAGLNMSYDAGAKRFFLSSKGTGESAQLVLAGADTALFAQKAYLADKGQAPIVLGEEPVTLQGKNARVTFNGGSPIEYPSNDFTLNGLNISVKAVSETAQTIKVSTDVQGAYDKIKGFVDEYNKLVDVLNAKLEEKTYRSYQPLTEAQRKEMKEADIKLWDEKAKSGMLQADETLTAMLSGIRQDLYQDVQGAGALFEVGITTGSYKDKGRLVIDETKLKQKLSEDPAKVINTLFSVSETAEANFEKDDTPEIRAQKTAQNQQRKSENGAFMRLFDGLAQGMGAIVQKAGPGEDSRLLRDVKGRIMTAYVIQGNKSDLEKVMADFGKRMDRENARLSGVESRYWKQFTAMEKAMQQMQSQSSWLTQQMGGQ